MVATIGLSQVLFLLTLLPFIRPKKLFRAFPVPINWTFSIGTFQFTPGDVLTLIVAPIVAIALALFIRFSPWGLAMRASAENSRVGPAVGRVGATDLHGGVDPGRRAVRHHRRAVADGPDERARPKCSAPTFCCWR